MSKKKDLDTHNETKKNNSFRFYKSKTSKKKGKKQSKKESKKQSKKESKKQLKKKENKKKDIISDLDFLSNIMNLNNNNSGTTNNNEFIKIIPIDSKNSKSKFGPQFNLLDMLLNKKNESENVNEFSSDSDSDNELDIKDSYDEIDCNLNNIQDLINLAKKYNKTKKNLAFNNNKLYKLIKPMEELNEMIGMYEVKKQVINQIIYSLQGLDNDKGMMHTIITGPPGVGKTMLGYLLAKIYYKMGLVKQKKGKFTNPINGKMEDFKFTIARRSDLIGEYVGHTATKTQNVINKALGGILFIDEAYSLGNEEKKDIYSKECIDTINQNLSENKGKIIVIIAGYEEQLEKCFFAYNPGLKRRFSFRYKIDNYNYTELSEIFKKQIKDIDWNLDTNINNEDFIMFFKNNYKEFIHYGGDMELLLLCSKITHAMRIFGKHPKYRKSINLDDIQKGLVMFKSSRISKDENMNFKNMYI